MKKLLLIAGLMIMGFNSHAGIDKGNGGSGSESLLVGQQAQLESVALKLRSFFLRNEADLKPLFPEFDIQVLVKKIKTSDIRVVDEEKLIDKNGVSRTCLNFPDSSLIECKSSAIDSLLEQPATLFVLIFHEYLGLIGAEETSPANPAMISGYSISKRIAPYVTKVNNYDLVIPKKVAVTLSQSNEVRHVLVCSQEGSPVKTIVEERDYFVTAEERIQRNEAALGDGFKCMVIGTAVELGVDVKKIKDSFAADKSLNRKSIFACSVSGSSRLHLVNTSSVEVAEKEAARKLYLSNWMAGHSEWKVPAEHAHCVNLKGNVDLELFKEAIDPVLFENLERVGKNRFGF